MALRSYSRTYWHSGIVIAGFGEEEIFPSFVCYDIDGVVAEKLRLIRRDSVRIDPYQSEGIFAFAQGDVIATMIDGMQPRIPKILKGFLSKSLEQFDNYIVEHYTEDIVGSKVEDLRRDLADFRGAVVDNCMDDIRGYIAEEHSGPILSTVSGLPKEQLAEMAEALVSLTSFQRRVTPGDETVGGPVDVAVISKGDGFVWIKRKHYFLPELNPRYMRELQSG